MQITLENSSVIRQGKFFYVFLCQVLLLVLFPYLRQPGLLVFLRLLVAVAFVSGVYGVSDKRAQWITALALAIPAIARFHQLSSYGQLN
jgi:predicted RND superfamily exporter protein